jgi:hypothetical protein
MTQQIQRMWRLEDQGPTTQVLDRIAQHEQLQGGDSATEAVKQFVLEFLAQAVPSAGVYVRIDGEVDPRDNQTRLQTEIRGIDLDKQRGKS